MSVVIPFPPRLHAVPRMTDAFAPWAGRKIRVRATGERGRVIGWLADSAQFVVRMESHEVRHCRPGDISMDGDAA